MLYRQQLLRNIHGLLLFSENFTKSYPLPTPYQQESQMLCHFFNALILYLLRPCQVFFYQ